MGQASGAAYPQAPGLLGKMILVPVACWLRALLLQEIPRGTALSGMAAADSSLVEQGILGQLH